VTGVSDDGPPPLNVLIVDDVVDLRRVLRVVIASDPRFRVVGEAADGAEAAALAASLRPDIVLLDLVMPGVGGLAALPELRRVAPAARVVVLSNLDDADLRGQARSLGAVGYLDKASTAAELLDGLGALVCAMGAADAGLAEARSSLAAEVGSAGSARQFVDSILARWGYIDPLDVVKLLVSELVTNAVVHARSEAEVVVRLHGHVVHVEVLDDSAVMPVLRAPLPEDTSGRGVALVDALASSWGARQREGGKVVWFEVPVAG
jgi:DNA-binding NarL/FixJ family response regulator